jgi:hypothetical protein
MTQERFRNSLQNKSIMYFSFFMTDGNRKYGFFLLFFYIEDQYFPFQPFDSTDNMYMVLIRIKKKP